MAEVKVNHRYQEVSLHDDWKAAYDQRYWDYRDRWHEVPLRKLKTDFPLHLDIEITNVCNLLCPMCPRTLIIKNNIPLTPYFIDIRVFQLAVSSGFGNGLCAVNLNAAGETLFHPDIVRMVDYAKNMDVLDVMFHTNATLLTESLSYDLVSAGLDKLIVSFDSPVKEHYEKIRVGASYDQVLNNVRQFVEIRNRRNRKLPQVRINMVVMQENEGEIEQMIDLWRDYADTIGFLGCINPLGLDDTSRSTTMKGYDYEFTCDKLW